MTIKMPAMKDGTAEEGELLWNFELPATDAKNKLEATITCASSTNYWGTSSDNTYFGLSAADAKTYPHSIAGAEVNGYTRDVDMSVEATHTIKLKAMDKYVSTTEVNYYVLFPTKTTTATKYVAPLDCSASFTYTDAKGYSRKHLELTETDNGP